MDPIDLRPAAHELAGLVRATQNDQLHDPTPCTGMTVGALLDHIGTLAAAFTAAGRKTPSDDEGPPPEPTGEQLPARWRSEIPARLADMAAAWMDRAAWQGTARAGGVTAAAPEMGTVALDELVLHGWDLAVATGQPFHCDPASTQAVLDFTEAVAARERAGERVGLFGPVVQVPEGASRLDRALGLAGREPEWPRPASA